MTQHMGPPSMPVSGRHAWKPGLVVLVRVMLSVSLLFAAYYLIPARRASEGSDLPWLILELCVFGVIVGIQVPAIVKARYPILRAVEALAILVALYLLIFARIYLSNSLNDPSAFTLSLDHTTALYFTVTVFATVGFGDIVAQTDNMRLLVTAQMLLNLVVLGLVIRLLTSAARRGVVRRGGQPDLGDRDRPGD
jgi:UDP-N-acetylmuramyl pentapeptide phosphotransferase/UDP-N-acetylglucosamine-1-phosphate transferase